MKFTTKSKTAFILAFYIILLGFNSVLSGFLKRTETNRSKFRVSNSNTLRTKAAKFYKSLTENYKKMESSTNEPKIIENPTWQGFGYNLMRGNPTVSPASGQAIDAGFTTNIFKNSYDKNNKTPDGFYKVPNGFVVEPVQVCNTNMSSKSISSDNELKTEMKTSLGLSGKVPKATFGLNSEYSSMKSKIKKDNKTYIENSAYCSIYRSVLNRYDPPELSTNFVQGLKNLSKSKFVSIDANNKDTTGLVFFEFIEEFGTHYISELLMGSRFTSILETDSHKLLEMKSKGFDVSVEAKKVVGGTLGTPKDPDASAPKTSTIKIEGGQPTQIKDECGTGSIVSEPAKFTTDKKDETKDSGVNIKSTEEASKANLGIGKNETVLEIGGEASAGGKFETSTEMENIISNRYITTVGAPMPQNLNLNCWIKASKLNPLPVSYIIRPLFELLEIENIKEKISKIENVNYDTLISNLKQAYKDYPMYLERTGQLQSEPTYFGHEIEKSTNMVEGDTFWSLEKHTVDCGPNAALSFLKLGAAGKNIGFTYKCFNEESITQDCTMKQTVPTKAASKGTGYVMLSNHKMECPVNNVLSQFNMVVNDTTFFFKYNCCKTKFHDCSPQRNGKKAKTDNTKWMEAKDAELDSFSKESKGVVKSLSLNFDQEGKSFWYSFVACRLQTNF